MRLAFVVQRYGREVNGGAELHCRMLAERLARRDDVEQVTVLTSCAKEYSHWGNDYAPGVEHIEGVRVERFAVPFRRVRAAQSFIGGLLTLAPRQALTKPLRLALQPWWLLAQGPVLPGLLPRLYQLRDDYDGFIFFTYLYFPTAVGMHVLADKAILWPTAHDEPPIYFEVFGPLFRRARAIAFNTEEERDFVVRRFGVANTPHQIIGCGVEIDASAAASLVADPQRPPFLLYLGRIDRAKGVDALCRSFVRFKERHGDEILQAGERSYRVSELELRLAGGGNWADIPERADIVREGFVSDADKLALLKECEVLVLPSHFESLSLVMLEAWTLARPVLVDAACAVTAGHIARSAGGRSYRNDDDFAVALLELLADPQLRMRLGEAGRSYVSSNYAWPLVEQRVLDLVRQIAPTKGADR